LPGGGEGYDPGEPVRRMAERTSGGWGVEVSDACGGIIHYFMRYLGAKEIEIRGGEVEEWRSGEVERWRGGDVET
jgi:hypothetical protein